jgi:hypothetical protein
MKPNFAALPTDWTLVEPWPQVKNEWRGHLSSRTIMSSCTNRKLEALRCMSLILTVIHCNPQESIALPAAFLRLRVST